MAEEKQNNPVMSPTMDDLSVMRLLLHTIKGISMISSNPELQPYNEQCIERDV